MSLVSVPASSPHSSWHPTQLVPQSC